MNQGSIRRGLFSAGEPSYSILAAFVMEHSKELDSMEEEEHELMFRVKMRNGTYFRVLHFIDEDSCEVKIEILKDQEEKQAMNTDEHLVLEQEELQVDDDLEEEVDDNFDLIGEDQEEAEKPEPERRDC